MQYDLVITNGTLIEPSLDLVTVGNLGIKGGKVQTITRTTLEGKKFIDASGQIVCPGFVDIHSHVENYLYGGRLSALQGITTAVNGNCGLSPVEPKKFFDKMANQGFPINQAQLVGHSFSLREEVGITDRNAPANEEQIAKMAELTEERLAQGALGVSFGLEYAPGSSYQELKALCKVAARYGKLAAIHTRHDSWEGLKAIEEALQLTRETGVALQISHLVYMVGMGMMTEALTMISETRRQGLDVTADSGLYSAFATFIGSAVFDPGCLEKWGRSYRDLYISTGPHAHKQCTEELFHKLRQEEPETVIVAFVGQDAEVVEALLEPYVVVTTDGFVGSPAPGSGHPQDSGTFPKFFRLMVRETGLLTPLEAVKKCTLQPAQRMGIKNKGTLKPGSDADVVIFDLDKIQDKSDYPGLGQPDASPAGISHVIVNGETVVDEGKFLDDVRPGKPVTLPNKPWSL